MGVQPTTLRSRTRARPSLVVGHATPLAAPTSPPRPVPRAAPPKAAPRAADPAQRAALRAPAPAAAKPAPAARAATPAESSHRVRSLDGLRGIAALVVLLNHALIAVVPVLAATYAGAAPPRAGTGLWWLGYTPLRVIWSGPQAVVLFFVLSGFVLALPAVRRGGRWFDASYYPRRLLRLYLPVWAALVVAVALHRVVTRVPVVGASWWLNWHAVPVTLRDWLSSAGLLHERNGFEFSSALASLKWEVLFSAVLPLALLFPILTRRRPAIAAAGAVGGFVVIFYGTAHGNLYAEMLPMFLIGSVLAFQAGRLRELVARGRGLPKSAAWTVAGVLALVGVALVTSPYWALNPQVHLVRLGAYRLYAATMVAVTAGAALILCLAMLLPTWRRVLESHPIQWLGSRSYSLYLVHEPLVVTIAFLLGGRPAVLPYLLLAVGASLLLAELFWRAVERPGLALARWTGAAVKRTLSGWVVSPPAPARRPPPVRRGHGVGRAPAARFPAGVYAAAPVAYAEVRATTAVPVELPGGMTNVP